MSITNLKFVPFAPTMIEQSLRHGRKKRVQKFCTGKRARSMRPITPEGTEIRVRYIKGGSMYANLRAKTKKPAWVHSLNRVDYSAAPAFGAQAKAAPPAQKPVAAAAPAAHKLAAVVAPAPTSFQKLLGNLNAAEMARRAQALRGAHA